MTPAKSEGDNFGVFAGLEPGLEFGIFILVPGAPGHQRRFERIGMSRGGERYVLQAHPAFRESPPDPRSGQCLLSPQL
jgi:hypothetical protein